jgi:hypothetical protein
MPILMSDYLPYFDQSWFSSVINFNMLYHDFEFEATEPKKIGNKFKYPGSYRNDFSS